MSGIDHAAALHSRPYRFRHLHQELDLSRELHIPVDTDIFENDINKKYPQLNGVPIDRRHSTFAI